MEEGLNKILSNRVLHFVLALCLLSSLFPFYNGKYIAIVAMMIMALLNSYKGKNIPLLFFWGWAMVCSIVNGLWGLRDVAWTIVMLATTPMLGQSRISMDVFKAMFRLLPFFVLANLIAYLLNFNVFSILYQEPNKFCFSGLTCHPQWLGAFTGLACVYTYYHAVIKKKGDRLKGVISIVFFLMSVELGLLAGSRAALLSASITIAAMTCITCENIYDFLRRTGVVLVMLVFLMPIFLQSIEMIEIKQIAQNDYGISRLNLWMTQFQLIKDNLVCGTGLIGGETGNGWLEVASKTGVIGAVCIIVILIYCTKRMIPIFSIVNEALMPVCIFIYLFFHSCFEGYILTPGYLGCYVFWSCIGILLSFKKIKK